MFCIEDVACLRTYYMMVKKIIILMQEIAWKEIMYLVYAHRKYPRSRYYSL